MSSAHRYHLPRDRRYHPREHLWVKPEGAGEPESVLIGMDELQLDNLGELAYVDLKPAGTVVQAGDSFGTLEAAKMTAEIFAPLSGTIVQVNEAALTRRCCTGVDRDCGNCFDVWEHFSWIILNMKKHLGSIEEFTNWLTSMYLFYLINRLVDYEEGLAWLPEIHRRVGVGTGQPVPDIRSQVPDYS